MGELELENHPVIQILESRGISFDKMSEQEYHKEVGLTQRAWEKSQKEKFFVFQPKII